MIIKLKHGFFVEAEEKNFTLKSEYTNQKTGEQATRTHGYFSSLESAIRKYIMLATIDSDYAIELNDLLEKIKAVCEETIQTIKSHTVFKGE